MKIDPHSIVLILADLEICEYIQGKTKAISCRDVAEHIAESLNTSSKRSVRDVREQISKVNDEYVVELGNLNRRFAEAHDTLEAELAAVKPKLCMLSKLNVGDTFVEHPDVPGAFACEVIDTNGLCVSFKSIRTPESHTIGSSHRNTLVYPVDIVDTFLNWELKS